MTKNYFDENIFTGPKNTIIEAGEAFNDIQNPTTT